MLMISKKTLTLMAALTALSASAWAQTAPPAHQSLLGKLFHHPAKTGTMPMHHSMLPFHHTMTTPGTHPSMFPSHHAGSAAPIAGGVIGNKHSHVYHLSGDKSLPSEKNRVYFSSAAAAEAAGYHASGSSHGSTKHSTSHKKSMH
jgi:hypothetical protein